MQAILLSCLAFVLFTSKLVARDQVPQAEKSSKGSLDYNPIDGTIMSQSKQYPKSIEGLRHYLDQELAQDTPEYNRLNSKLQDLESQSKFADRLSMIPAGLGIGSLLVGSLLRQDEEPTDPRVKSIHDTGGRLMLYGIGGLAGAFLLNHMLSPDDDDIQAFIRFHNGQASQPHNNSHNSMSLNLLSGDQLITLSYTF